MAAGPQFSEFTRSYNSFSGIDIKATFNGVVVGELQAISYSITREKAPIYTMGSADPRSFSRGKRGIAGSLIFIMFDRPALIGALRNSLFQSDKDDIHPDYETGTLQNIPEAANAERNSINELATDVAGASMFSDQEEAMPWYVDQIPGIDITLAAANEYGALAYMKIWGAEILNSGSGHSIDDIVTEEQCTYIARAIKPWSYVQPMYDLKK